MYQLTSICFLVGLFALGLHSVKGQYNYNDALSKSIRFFEAQRSGRLPSNNRIPWRGDSALNDRGASNEDLTGGWYDAGDYVKFGFPMAQATTTLLWGVLEFEAGYRTAGEYNNILASLRWPLDYFRKCHVSNTRFYGQVGDGNVDHNYWGRAEDMTMNRPSWSITNTAPGSDLAAETAASFAAGYLVYRTSDSTYAFDLLDRARRLYDLAYNNRGLYSNAITNARQFYPSTGYNDELAWGAAWLYRATGEQTYLSRALEFASTSATAWAFDWDEKTVGYQLLLYSTANQNAYGAGVERFLRNWFPGGTVSYTPKGLAWLIEWGATRYAANSAFIALVAAKYGLQQSAGRTFARNQINYMLGGQGRSLVCGFGTNPPTQPHHAGASCRDRPATCDWSDYSKSGPNPQVLNGALVGGPDRNDNYQDNRQDYIKNEVTCDYNAGFQSALAGIISL